MEKRAPSFQSTPHMASQTINGLFRTVSPTVQIALLSITRRFEEMDATINAQLQSLTPSIATSSIGAGEEEPHIGSRSTSYKTSEEDMLAYLEESTFKKSWMQGLSSLSNKWAQSNMSDTSGEALFQIKLLERAADRLPDLLVAACAGNRLPSSVVLGIESRIEVVETFLDSCESLMQIKHVGLGSNTASYSDRPSVLLADPIILPKADKARHQSGCNVLSPTPSRTPFYEQHIAPIAVAASRSQHPSGI
ncbi:hypothetical protein MMC12_006229 [Toensbergia leucococca]|nr:hypothetical protein [Toensbergia leucococca]